MFEYLHNLGQQWFYVSQGVGIILLGGIVAGLVVYGIVRLGFYLFDVLEGMSK